LSSHEKLFPCEVSHGNIQLHYFQGQQVTVNGGGKVAFDMARTARRLGGVYGIEIGDEVCFGHQLTPPLRARAESLTRKIVADIQSRLAGWKNEAEAKWCANETVDLGEISAHN